MFRHLATALLAMTWWLYAQPAARAQEPLRIALLPCAQPATLDLDLLLDIARAELMPRPLQLVDSAEPGALLVDACSPGELRLSRQGQGAALRTVSLADVAPDARPRVAALALAELVDAAVEPPPPASALTTPPKERSAPAMPLRMLLDAPPPPTPGWLGLGLESRLFVLHESLYVGPRVTWARPRFELRLLTLFTRRTHTLGRVRGGVVSVQGALPLLRSRQRPAALLSLAGELGVTWARGDGGASARTEGSAVSLFAAGLLKGAVGWAMGQGLGRLELGVGYAKGLIARAEQQALISSHGPFVLLALELGRS